MNSTSSRSHAVFTIVLTQKVHDEMTNLDCEVDFSFDCRAAGSIWVNVHLMFRR